MTSAHSAQWRIQECPEDAKEGRAEGVRSKIANYVHKRLCLMHILVAVLYIFVIYYTG